MKTFFLTLLAFAFALSANSTFAQPAVAAKQSKDEQEIRRLLQSTADGWNEGDLPKYLGVYTKDATEMLSTGPAGGVEAIEKTMKDGFWKTGRPIQHLHYENVVVKMLDKKAAYITGKFVLTGAGRPDRTGWFTTIWMKTKDGWKTVHDHS